LGWRCVGWCEIDKWCQRAYRVNFGTEGGVEGEFFWGDASKMQVDFLPSFDVLCSGFPCQSFSFAGNRRGFEDAKGTLVYEIFKVLEAKRPMAFILENVKGLVCKPFGDREFPFILRTLHGLGYRVFWRVLNAKDHGLPQNRERVFILGFLKNIRSGEDFTWPSPVALKMSLTDVLEKNVSKKYFLSKKMIKWLTGHPERRRADLRLLGKDRNSVTGPIMSSDYKIHGDQNFVVPSELLEIGSIYAKNATSGRVYSPKGIARALTEEAEGVGGKTGLYEVKSSLIHSRGLETKDDGTSHAIKGGAGGHSRVHVALVNRPKEDWFSQHAIYDEHGIAPSLRGDQNDPSPRIFSNAVDRDGYLREAGHHYNLTSSRIRRLTPRECARLQGFPESFRIIVSDSQAYRQFGNAVPVPVVEAVGRQMERWLMG